MGSTIKPPPPPTSIPIGEIKVPLPIVRGKYEELTREQLLDHYYDILHEMNRRNHDRPA